MRRFLAGLIIAFFFSTTVMAGTQTITCAGGGQTYTDGTNTVSSATQLTVTGGTIGGTSPNATLTISGSSQPYVKVSETETSGTDGGTATENSWTNRVLNTIDTDTASIASLGSNLVTLPAGTYIVNVKSPFAAVDWVQCRLYDTTHSTVLLLGINTSATASAGSRSYAQIIAPVSGLIVLTSPSALAVQYYVQYSSGTQDLGSGHLGIGTQVYTTAEFIKI